tara:strand:- start:1763 stop:2602 length:840 start_codon:yes stop_codon:yes gene_type:complete
MKYSYTSSHRGGKSHYKLLAQLNNKSFCGIQQGRELHATIIRDNIISWYWEEYGGTVCWEDKEIDLTNKEIDLDYTKECYRKDGSMWLDFDRPLLSNNLYKVFPKFFECDFILYPLPLLGYFGYPKPGDNHDTIELCAALEQQDAWMTVDLEYSIKELRKRRNIIAYKEDKRHEAWNFFTGGGDATLLKDGNEQEYYRQCSLRIDEARRLPNSVRKLYNHYNIPYEMFSLDTGDYKKVFNINKDIPNNYTQKFDTDNIIQKYIDSGKINKWIDEYLSEV